MFTGIYVKYPSFCQVLIKLEFSRQIFEKIPKYKISWVIRPVGAVVLYADGQTDGRTDMTKPTVALLNFVNATKNT
jgi:hypothetical protein